MTIVDYLDEVSRDLALAAGAGLQRPVGATIDAIVGALAADKPLLVCGNGGSAADAMHIAGELVGRYLVERRAWKAIALGTDPAVTTAWSNDHHYHSLVRPPSRGAGRSRWRAVGAEHERQLGERGAGGG